MPYFLIYMIEYSASTYCKYLHFDTIILVCCKCLVMLSGPLEICIHQSDSVSAYRAPFSKRKLLSTSSSIHCMRRVCIIWHTIFASNVGFQWTGFNWMYMRKYYKKSSLRRRKIFGIFVEKCLLIYCSITLYDSVVRPQEEKKAHILIIVCFKF